MTLLRMAASYRRSADLIRVRIIALPGGGPDGGAGGGGTAGTAGAGTAGAVPGDPGNRPGAGALL